MKYDSNLIGIVEKEISTYFAKVEKKFDKGVFKYFKANPGPNVNVLKDRYRVLKAGSLFSYSITTQDNVHILIIIDLHSNYVPARLVSFVPITVQMSARFLDNFFSNLYLDHQTTLLIPLTNVEESSANSIIHNANIKGNSFCDSNKNSGMDNNEEIILNSENAVENVCLKYNILTIISSPKHDNLISENVNRTLWYFVSNFCIKGLEKTSFLDLTPKYQELLIDVSINYMNTNYDTKANKLLENTSHINKNVDYLMYKYPYQVIAQHNSKDAPLIIYSNSAAVSKIKNLLKYRLKLEKGISIILSKIPEAFREKELQFIQINSSLDDQISESKLITSQQEGTIIKSMLNSGTTEEIPVYLDNLLKNDKNKISFETKLLASLLGILIKSQASDNNKLSYLNTTMTESKEIKEQVGDLQKDLKTFIDIQKVEGAKRKEKELKLIKRKINNKCQNRDKYAIFNEDFKVILECVISKQRYILCRDKIAHAVLKYTGLRISNLKFVTLGQLLKFFNYEELTIQSINSKNLKPLFIPVVKSASDIIESVRPYWTELKSILKKKGIVIDESYNPYEIKESELWGNNKFSKLGKNITREQLNRRINSQLKAAGIRLNKKLTSHSYRRGVAIQVGKTLGIYAAKKILNHASISTTQFYLESNTTTKELIDIYNSAHKDSGGTQSDRKKF